MDRTSIVLPVAVLLAVSAAPPTAGGQESSSPPSGSAADADDPVRAQSPTGDTLRAYRLGSGSAAGDGDEGREPVQLDGRLSESFWQRAHRISGFRQREPDMGEAATEETDVRIAYGRETLYVGIVAHDDTPDRVVSRILQRDQLMRVERGEQLRFTGDDAVAVLFDPFHDHRNGIVFATNPNGAQFDALVTDEGGNINTDWRGVWRVEAARTEEGWAAEMAIPFQSLRYPDDTGAENPWGFNVFRMIQRKQEQVLWQSWTREGGGFLRVSQAGHLTGLTDLPSQGLDLEAKPYVLGRMNQRPETAAPGLRTTTTGDVGLDLKAEPRPGLVLDLTYNTDFAQVEVDPVRVNLSRFSLFFPEKRDFFLENAGIFNLGVPGGGMGPPPFLLFFSRRIGISGGEQVPILGGGRLTGRVGDQTVGLMNVTTGETDTEPRTNFGVARYKRDIGENGYVGGMLTDRRTVGSAPSGAGEAALANTAGGVDASYWLNDRLNVQGFLTGSVTEGTGGDGHAYRASVAYNSDRFGFEAQQLTISPEMNARSGFVTRTDVRRYDGFFRFSPRPDLLGIRKLDLGTPMELFTDMDGDVLDWRIGNFFGVSWDSGDRLESFYMLSEVTVREDFALADTIPVPAGEYENSWIGGRFNSSRARSVVFSADARWQQKFGGDQLTYGGKLSVQPMPELSLEARFQRNEVDTPRGSFVADIARLRADVALSTKLTTNVFVQYNSLTENILTNVRFNFIHKPGSDLFLVFTEDRGSPRDPWSVEDRGLTAKLTYLYRF